MLAKGTRELMQVKNRNLTLRKGIHMEDLTRFQSEYMKTMLKELKAKGVSQNEFAKRVGVTPQTVSRWKHGACSVSDYNARQIVAEFPEYEYEDIIGLEGYYEAVSDAEYAYHTNKEKYLFNVIALSFDGTIESPAKDVGFHPGYVDALMADCKFQSHDGKQLVLSWQQMNSFKKEICGYIAMRLNQMLERGVW